jgi:hypothetical protein
LADFDPNNNNVSVTIRSNLIKQLTKCYAMQFKQLTFNNNKIISQHCLSNIIAAVESWGWGQRLNLGDGGCPPCPSLEPPLIVGYMFSWFLEALFEALNIRAFKTPTDSLKRPMVRIKRPIGRFEFPWRFEQGLTPPTPVGGRVSLRRLI